MGSTSGPPDANYGFIGLGNMGFGMAKNVRQKIPSSSKLIVCELNKLNYDYSQHFKKQQNSTTAH